MAQIGLTLFFLPLVSLYHILLNQSADSLCFVVEVAVRVAVGGVVCASVCRQNVVFFEDEVLAYNVGTGFFEWFLVCAAEFHFVVSDVVGIGD